MNCICPEGYILNADKVCEKIEIIPNIVCPDGCTIFILADGNAECRCIDTLPQINTKKKTSIDFSDPYYFEEASWTISFKPLEGQWLSYYNFLPDYYVNHNHYFQTGYNYYKNSTWTGTLSSHLLTNKSFGVFNGEAYPFVIEFPVKSEYVKKVLETVTLNVEAKRYQNEFDYAVNKYIGFTQATIYNATNNSGRLNLFVQKTYSDISRYPKTNADNTQDIMYTSIDGTHTFNYFYNRTKNQDNNTEIWLNDKVRISKTINSNAVAFKGKPVLERMKGEYFLVRLEATNTQHEIILKNSIQEEKIG